LGAWATWVWLQAVAAAPPPEQQQQPITLLERLWGYINHTWTVGNFPFSIATLTLGLLAIIFAVVFSRYLRRFIERRMAHHKHLDPGVQFTILRLVHYFIMAVGAIVALRISVSADFTSLAVAFTALSIGIGFGLQFIAGDIASGFIILFERPVRVGDYITIPGPDGELTEGMVRSINLRTTVVITNNNIASIVPNSKIVNQNFLNWTYNRERRVRVAVPVGVSYDADPDHVTRTLLRAAEGVQFVLEEPKPTVQFMEFADSSLNFRLLVWSEKPRRHLQVKSALRYNIHRLFKEEGIEIPFPQRDVTLKNVPPRPGGREQPDADAAEEAEARP
jgi:small-conductance mechanosensitive channel